MKANPSKIKLTNGTFCPVTGAAGVSVNADHKVFVNDHSGQPLCAIRCPDRDTALLEVAHIAEQLAPPPDWLLFEDACCRISAIATTNSNDFHRVFVMNAAGDILCAVQCSTADEAQAVAERISEATD